MSEVIKMRVQDVVNLGGGGSSDKVWLPTVDENGDISWTLSESTTPPETQNIKGEPGTNGTDGDDGVGIASVSVNASNHLIVTKTDGTTEDAGAINVTVPIDDTEAASNKVYSSSKVESIASGKLNASYASIVPGDNLIILDKCKTNWKPSDAAGSATYEDGTTRNNTYTSNLIPCVYGETFKFSGTIADYFRLFIYNSAGIYRGNVMEYTTDTDGNYYVQVSKESDAAYVLFVVTRPFTDWVVKKYSEWNDTNLVFDKLSLDANGEEELKKRLGIASDKLYKKKWAVAGDSYSAGYGISETITSGRYAGKLAVYPYLIANKYDIDIINFTRSGRTLAYPVSGTFDNSFSLFYQKVPTDADYLTIYLGINDCYKRTEGSTEEIPIGTPTDETINTYYGAWNVILTWLITNRPNLKIGIIATNGAETDDYRQATIAMATKYGIPYIDLNGDARTPCMVNSTNTNIASDVKAARNSAWRVDSGTNNHPNAACHAYESTIIEEFLRTL